MRKRAFGYFLVGSLHEFVGWFQGRVPLDHLPTADSTIGAPAVSNRQFGIAHEVLRSAVRTDKVARIKGFWGAHRGYTTWSFRKNRPGRFDRWRARAVRPARPEICGLKSGPPIQSESQVITKDGGWLSGRESRGLVEPRERIGCGRGAGSIWACSRHCL
jgi:hypothetical protein